MRIVLSPVLLLPAAVALAATLGSGLLAQEPVKIAFVDTGNTGRSLTAESLARVLVTERRWPVAVISRGVDVDPFDVRPEANAAILLKQRGIDVSGHTAAQMTSNDARHADVILTLTARHKATVLERFPEAKDKTFTLAEYATGQPADVPDAWGKPMDVYVAMMKQVEAYVGPALEKAVAARAKASR